jgi:AcrR family transcriptional regulator
MARTGRRPGPSTTRAALLEAARRRFGEAGYDATSIRAVASDAGVDPAVALHYFGSKEGLFRAALGWPFDPALLASRLAADGSADVGERVARVFLEFWEDPTTGPALLAVLRSGMTHPAAGALLREFVVQELFARLTELAERPPAALRVDLAAAQMVGLAVLRYALRVEPIASASAEELVALLAPALRQHLEPECAGSAVGG